jgi:FKBP-type peptidyl-prolyl cis-trans isomerase FkpA
MKYKLDSMNRKIFGRLLLFGIMAGLLATSCMKTDIENEYTPEKEREKLQAYLSQLVSSGYNIDTTASGIYYVNLTPGEGDYPVEGDTLFVQYAGYLVTGELFDASGINSVDSTMNYVHKEMNMIAGWEEMIGRMNKGKKMQFILPSNLAYGATGAGFIPPYSTLIFVAKMVDIRPKIL